MKSLSLIDTNHGEELLVITFCSDGVHAYLVQCKKMSQYWFAFSTDEHSDTLESSAINDVRSMLAMFLAVLYMVEGLETETLK